MSDFQQSLSDSGLGAALVASGRQPMKQEAADLAVAIAKAEFVSPSLISFTHLCEHGFEIAPSLPNVNKKPESVWNWDIGPFQLNLQWAIRSIFQGDFKSDKLLFTDVFGHSFYEADGITPCPFNGDPVANGRLAARRLMAVRAAGLNHKDATRFRAVKFTGPDHQQRRGELYDILNPAFEKFFELYI